MTKDDILQALRLTAMGRYGHDLQVKLAEELEKVFAAHNDVIAVSPEPIGLAAALLDSPLKRGPGRPKKAD